MDFTLCLSVADLGGSLLETNDNRQRSYVEMLPFLQLFSLISSLVSSHSRVHKFTAEKKSKIKTDVAIF